MSLGKDEVLAIAKLAQIDVPATRIEALASDLTKILELVAQLDDADTTNVEPMAHPLDVSARLRPDVVTETDQRALFQQGAPATANGLYLVPKVID